MFIALPLMLIGIGFMIYFLFAAATYMLPIYVGVGVGFAASHAGASQVDALLLGVVGALVVTALGHGVANATPSRSLRIGIMALFAIPAAIVGFEIAAALLTLVGSGGFSTAFALAAGLGTGAVAARRFDTLRRV